MPKLVAAAAASTRGHARAEASSESTEQLYHPDFGWSPLYERVPKRAAFIEAMATWGKASGRVVVENMSGSVLVFVDLNQVANVRVRD